MTTSLISTAGTSNDSMPCRPRNQPMRAIAARMPVVRSRPAGGGVESDRLQHERREQPKIEADRDHVGEAQYNRATRSMSTIRAGGSGALEDRFAVCDVETHRRAERVAQDHDADHRERCPGPDGRRQQGSQYQEAAPDNGCERRRGRPPSLRHAHSTGTQQPCARSQGNTNSDSSQTTIPGSIGQTCAASSHKRLVDARFDRTLTSRPMATGSGYPNLQERPPSTVMTAPLTYDAAGEREAEHHVRDLLGIAVAAQRHAAAGELLLRVVGDRRGHAGADRARAHAVHGDALRAELDTRASG